MSVLQQTRAFETVLIIDDLSDDNSFEIIEGYCHDRPGWLCKKGTEHRGVVELCNLALRELDTEYVAFLAADDILDPQYHGQMADLIRAFPGQALYSCRANLIGPNREARGLMRSPVPAWRDTALSPGQAQKFLLAEDSWIIGNAAIYNRTRALELGGFNRDLRSFADGYLSRGLAVTFGAGFTPKILVSWRRESGGFAGSDAGDAAGYAGILERTSQTICQDRREERMAFPKGYETRWRARSAFWQLVFYRNADAASLDRVLQSLFPKIGKFERLVLRYLLKAGRMGWLAGRSYLFLRIRPFDILSRLRQIVAVSVRRPG